MVDLTRVKKLLALLWQQYKVDCCPYPAKLESMYPAAKNDHIAFRSIRSANSCGIDHLKYFWEQCGYQKAGEYDLGNKFAIHMEHPCGDLPKIFLSEFLTDSLDTLDKAFINNIMSGYVRDWQLVKMPGDRSQVDFSVLPAEELVSFFFTNPFPIPPTEEHLEKLNELDQYLAWVRLFGNMVNHFTLSCNSIHTPIRSVYEEGQKLGVKMKDEIEGEGTELAQTSTEAVKLKVPVLNQERQIVYIWWPYAYYEIIERGQALFQGFKASQTHGLFNMTSKD